VKAIFLLRAPLLAEFSTRVWLFEHHLQQWVARLTRTPLQFGDNPFPTSGLKCLPPHGLGAGRCSTSHTCLFEESRRQDTPSG
jgi:hypothetical protein